MDRIAKFKKVSYKQYVKAYTNEFCENTITDMSCVKEMYEHISIPLRATKGSAGYDFSTPFDICLKPGESIKVPTGIRCKIDEGWVLMCFPRSSMGFKYRMQIDNTVGIIDSDYYYAENEGHIFIKISNNGNKIFKLKAGDKFAQGIFVSFGITNDDMANDERTGGIGSTGK
ncbi:deoxyuridine 5'-triphosphate nucleotidohydrolase [Mediterraneibacter sp. NSJ-55]|uniref:dUTP diphosphatase n=1 Tax=Mediterraneibacter hominis TaxID=2763054 RepID=A0A923LG31_9FIRM|nr:deoxyuridine 5'-triphosphate nucleotidohydrolase [Mediterraneibacter hominis]MBC5688072.1 deoxyuridine 5'-triphosphate nucleotidohydrolase [Mediterraneibacter hominis]